MSKNKNIARTSPNNINMISSKRYNKNKKVFDKILTTAVPNCGNDFIKYDEPGILKHIAGPNIKTEIKNKLIQNKEITTLNGNVYHVSISDKTIDKNKDNAVGFFDDLNLGNYSGIKSPVILADTYSWVYGMLKQGQNGGDRKIYIYNPLVVLADSASKVNINDEKKMKRYFDNPDGIKLINVVDEQPFKAPKFDINDGGQYFNKFGFFSNFSIITSLNENKKIQQTWSNLENQGANITSVTRCPAGELNNKSHTFNRMTQIINAQTNQTENTNTAAANRIAENNPDANKKRELFNIELQSKRSGDWLPVIYILNFDKQAPNLITFYDPANKNELSRLEKDNFFNKQNMYVLTVDTPLVAFGLYCGINMLYITADGKVVKFEAHPDNTFNL